MEDSKLQKLHETLKALAPRARSGGLGFYAKAGHRSRRSAADGMPEDKRALYSFFVRAGDGPSGHTHFADDGDKKLKKKKKKEEDEGDRRRPLLMRRRRRRRPRTRTTSAAAEEGIRRKRKEAAARLADIDAAYDRPRPRKPEASTCVRGEPISVAAPKKFENGAAPVKERRRNDGKTSRVPIIFMVTHYAASKGRPRPEAPRASPTTKNCASASFLTKEQGLRAQRSCRASRRWAPAATGKRDFRAVPDARPVCFVGCFATYTTGPGRRRSPRFFRVELPRGPFLFRGHSMIIVAVERLDPTSELHVHFDIFRALHAVLGSPVDRGVGTLRSRPRTIKTRHGFEMSKVARSCPGPPCRGRRTVAPYSLLE